MPNLYRPSAGNITNGYRSESGGPNKPIHLAVDFGWGGGRYVVAAMPGVLTFDKSSGYGLRGTIAHPDGSFTRYAHLESGSAERPVSMGEVIGVMGDTGTLAKGVHLHFEWIVRGAKRDPTPYFVTSRPDPEPDPTPKPQPTDRKIFMRLISNSSTPPKSKILTENGASRDLTAAEADACYRVIYDADGAAIAQSDINILDSILREINSPAQSALTQSQNDALMSIAGLIDPIPTQTEMSGIITNQYNLLRTGATNDKNEILAAIDEIPGGSAPQNLTVTLTGTAEAAQ